jgi:hypothetical protein
MHGCWRTPTTFEVKEVAEHLALAHNALDVQVRRGWHAERLNQKGIEGKWGVFTEDQVMLARGDPSDETWTYPPIQDDPVAALNEAEKWWVEIEKRG